MNPIENEPNPIHQDNRLRYKGHGQMESATESSSIAHVMSHELAHAAEFRSEARRDGRDIHSIDIKINYEIRNGKLVAVSGKTKALTYKNPEMSSSQDKENNFLESIEENDEEKNFSPKSKNNLEVDDTEFQKIEQEVNQINQEIEVLESSKNPEDKENLEKLKTQKEDLENQKREILLQELLQDLNEEINQSSMKLALTNITGNFINLKI